MYRFFFKLFLVGCIGLNKLLCCYVHGRSLPRILNVPNFDSVVNIRTLLLPEISAILSTNVYLPYLLMYECCYAFMKFNPLKAMGTIMRP